MKVWEGQEIAKHGYLIAKFSLRSLPLSYALNFYLILFVFLCIQLKKMEKCEIYLFSIPPLSSGFKEILVLKI